MENMEHKLKKKEFNLSTIQYISKVANMVKNITEQVIVNTFLFPSFLQQKIWFVALW